MKAKIKRSKETERLIKLYDSFHMVEFMDRSAKCDDVNVRVMRMLCARFGRFGRTLSFVECCDDNEIGRLEELAKSGDRVAAANLGQCYYQGLVVERDEAKAIEWFERAAKQGYLRGMASLGRVLATSEIAGLKQQGVDLLKRAAERGCAPAMCNYGFQLLDVAKSRQQIDAAKQWILNGADAGIDQGYVVLCNSMKVSPDEVARIVRRAWEHGLDIEGRFDPCLFSFGSSYGRGRLSCFALARMKIQELQTLAKRDPIAKTYLAYLYLDGTLGVAGDGKKAISLFKQAAQRDVAAAQCLLGECYYKGRDCQKDFGKAFYWFSRAAEQDELEALGWLGNMYYWGQGCKRNVRKSVAYQKRAATLGNEGAQYNLAVTYLGRYKGLEYSAEKAVNLLWPLACHGSYNAIARLGECYLFGEGVEKDAERGYGLLAVAERFTDIGELSLIVRARQQPGYLRFYEAVLSHQDETNVEPSILRMLEGYDQKGK